MPLFGKSPKSPQELVKSLRDSLSVLSSVGGGAKKADKAADEAAKILIQMKNILYGTGDQEPQSELAAQLAQEFYHHDLLLHLVQNLHRLDFEAKKDVAQIFNNILRRQIGTRSPTVEYICTKSEILFILIRGYENPEIALNCGLMLRECVRHEPLAKIVLDSEELYNIFRYVELSTFDIASDAFATFKKSGGRPGNKASMFAFLKGEKAWETDLLTRHKILCAQFLEQNYDKVFEHYQRLLNSENYVTRRQSLKLLGELLLDRHNFTTMTRYISNPENLKLMMTMLRDRSRNIQFEAFHVFKEIHILGKDSLASFLQVFVANPNKAKSIQDILLKNQDKLVEFLSKFHSDRTEDQQFNDEKSYLIKQIKEMVPQPVASGGAAV